LLPFRDILSLTPCFGAQLCGCLLPTPRCLSQHNPLRLSSFLLEHIMADSEKLVKVSVEDTATKDSVSSIFPSSIDDDISVLYYPSKSRMTTT
jgi:hypothetical protein